MFCSFSSVHAAPAASDQGGWSNDWQTGSYGSFEQQSFLMGGFANSVLGAYSNPAALRSIDSVAATSPKSTDVGVADSTASTSYQTFNMNMFGDAAGAIASTAVAPKTQSFTTTAAATGTTLLTYFNFNDSNTTSDAPGAQTTAINPSSTNGVSGFSYIAGTTTNIATGDLTGAGQALNVTGGTSLVNNGKSFEFSVSTVGFQNLSLSYATKGTSTGFNLQTVSYSIDGTTFTTLGTVTPTTTFVAQSFNLPTDANNDATVTFRFTLTGASGSTGSNTFDNIQVLGDITPVPEPTTVIGGLLGVVGLCWHQRRRLAGVVRSKLS